MSLCCRECSKEECQRCKKSEYKETSDIIKIKAEELKTKIENDPNLFVINVLSKDSYDDCHIRGSINVPLNTLENTAKDWDKNREIIVHCANYSCPLSKDAFHILKRMGFKNIYTYEGGTKEWLEKGFSTEGHCKRVS